jgi:hypothetical protein
MKKISIREAKKHIPYIRTRKGQNPDFYTLEKADDGWSKITYYKRKDDVG